MSTPPLDTPSPCVGICTLDPDTGLCKGCYRTLAEIGGWFNFDRERKLEALAAVAERRRTAGAPTMEAEREAQREARREARRRAIARHR